MEEDLHLKLREVLRFQLRKRLPYPFGIHGRSRLERLRFGACGVVEIGHFARNVTRVEGGDELLVFHLLRSKDLIKTSLPGDERTAKVTLQALQIAINPGRISGDVGRQFFGFQIPVELL
ncbi:hypothetical protein ACFONL_10060 [Camelimonas fluminis]|uniref:Uncharacterized protein n=1 Tax=Camelimonas fluminis TaxID=1576911 RepID=A0ABV7UH07_9HYPH|nr:hypothetical protein [Camelimonas fluminis]